MNFGTDNEHVRQASAEIYFIAMKNAEKFFPVVTFNSLNMVRQNQNPHLLAQIGPMPISMLVWLVSSRPQQLHTPVFRP